MGELQIVVFSLNGEWYGAETSQVQGIQKYQEASKIPGMPKCIDGVMHVRGKVVPVINLNHRFELGETVVTKKTKILMTSVNGKDVGCIVNDVLELLKLSEEDIEAPPEIIQKAGNTYIKKVAKKNEKLISILDFNRLLSDTESEKLNVNTKTA